jgi:hypothetical protein
VTVAVTLYALLELYKQGEVTWTQAEPFAEIVVSPQGAIPVGVAFGNAPLGNPRGAPEGRRFA